MISTSALCLHRLRGARDRAHLHLVDLRPLDAEPAAARAEHRVRLGERLDPAAHPLVRRLLERREELVQRRIEEADGDRQPAIASKIPSKSACWNGSSRSSAARRPASSEARIISCTTGSRSSPKNMCSVRQRPMPSRAELARLRRVRPRCRRSRAPSARRTSSAQPRIVSKSSLIAGGTSANLADDDAARAAVDGDHVALVQRVLADPHRLRVDVDLEALRSRRRTACPCRARRRPRARSCRRAR